MIVKFDKFGHLINNNPFTLSRRMRWGGDGEPCSYISFLVITYCSWTKEVSNIIKEKISEGGEEKKQLPGTKSRLLLARASAT